LGGICPGVEEEIGEASCVYEVNEVITAVVFKLFMGPVLVRVEEGVDAVEAAVARFKR
jgi:hypothetical protein